MCGRFAVKQSSTELAMELDAVLTDSAPEYPKYNVCPTNQIAVCISVNGTRRLGGMRWGFIPTSYDTPDSGPLIINARSETIVTKATFASLFELVDVSYPCLATMNGRWMERLGCALHLQYRSKFDGGGWYLANVGKWNSETGYLCGHYSSVCREHVSFTPSDAAYFIAA